MNSAAQESGSRRIAFGAAVAALYTVLTLILAPLSFGPVQMRISEALCVLPGFSFAAVPGLAVGCFLANLICGAPGFDVFFGALATLIGAAGTWLLGKYGRKHPGLRHFLWLPPVASNMLIIPLVLRYAYGSEQVYFISMLTVGAGELVSVGFFGTLLQKIIEKRQLLKG